MSPETRSLYGAHLKGLQTCTENVLIQTGHDGLVIASGSIPNYTDDDEGPVHRPTPHFAHWAGVIRGPGHLVHIRPGEQPQLLCATDPKDYWQPAIEIPPEVRQFFEVIIRETTAALWQSLKTNPNTAYIGPHSDFQQVVSDASKLNPSNLRQLLDWHRRRKTPYEIACIEEATHASALGICAAKQAFEQGASELEIYHAYLTASGATEQNTAFEAIVSLDARGAYLHRREKDPRKPDHKRGEGWGVLIDAGNRYNGYNSDITSTFVRQSAHPKYKELLAGLEGIQRDLCAQILPGLSFPELHKIAHLKIAALLLDGGLLQNCSVEAAIINGYTDAFFPHGLGHALGIQVHDVAGKQSGPEGGTLTPPDDHLPIYSWLRKLGILEAGEVMTIEPGIYFFPQKLAPFRNGEHAHHFNWDIINQLSGGMRIESDVVVTQDGYRDITQQIVGRRTNVLIK